MDPPIASIFHVLTADIERPIRVEYNQTDQIVIQLSEKFGQKVNLLGNSVFDATKIALVVFPVLVDTINLLNKSAEDADHNLYSDTNWFKTLQSQIEQQNIDTVDAVAAAQALLSNVVDKALDEISNSDGEIE